MNVRLFDLNIEEILDNWEIHHAIREIMANALDEQVLSKTQEISIYKDQGGNWHIRDYGRGIEILHFTLNENLEKNGCTSGVIGKFGVGLKDALATFNRHKIGVVIRSKFGEFRLREARKHGFDSITTLHVEFIETPLSMVGTDVELVGVTDQDISLARSLFLKFSDESIVETTEYGQILHRKPGSARVYINGVLASEEPNFLFTYNITNLTDAMKRKLNRERLNVGRSTYTDRVKAILKRAESEMVRDQLASQVERRSFGDQCDEIQWLDIAQIACNYLHERRKVTYITETEIQQFPDIVSNMREDGYTPVIVSETQKEKLDHQIQTGGPQVKTVETYVKEFNQSFQYQFVEPDELDRGEKAVFDRTHKILALVVQPMQREPLVRISRTMRINSDHTRGVWDAAQGCIIIHRPLLSNLAAYAGTLLHETAHALYRNPDASISFEQDLTGYLGMTAKAAITK